MILSNHQVTQEETTLEARCSLNVHLQISGLGQVQATGRGMTGEEAARHLRDTVDAVKALYTTPIPRTIHQQVAELLASGLAKATAKADWKLVERLGKAAALVLAGAVEAGNRAGVHAVQSQSDPLTWYEVEGTTCTCPDARKHAEKGEKYCCKHVLSVLLTMKLH